MLKNETSQDFFNSFIYVNFILTFSILTSPHREIVSGYICTKLTLIQFYGEKDQWKFQALIFSYSYSRSNKCTEKTSRRWVDGGFFFLKEKCLKKYFIYETKNLQQSLCVSKFETTTFSRISQVAKQKHFMIWDGTTTLKTKLTHLPSVWALALVCICQTSRLWQGLLCQKWYFPNKFFKSWWMYPFFIKSQMYSLQPELIVKCQSQRVYPTWYSCKAQVCFVTPLTKIHPQPCLPQPQFEMHAAPTGAERCICRTIFVFMAAAAEEILLIKLFYELRSQGEKDREKRRRSCADTGLRCSKCFLLKLHC